jgi:hypothetical protein
MMSEKHATIELENLTEAQELAVRVVMYEGALRYHERLVEFLETLPIGPENLEKIKSFPIE